MESAVRLKKRAVRIHDRLQEAYPDAKCELTFSNPFELAVAAILSAQCTDKRVNQVTPALFSHYKTLADWADASQATLEQEIHSIGFHRNKAKNIRMLAKKLIERHDGELPDTLEALVQLPGIGRKTANVLLITAFGKPGITVDTHCRRVAQRLELTKNDNPDRIERDLKAILPESRWASFSHEMVFHGRYCCHARKPDCPQCPLIKLCPTAEQFL